MPHSALEPATVTQSDVVEFGRNLGLGVSFRYPVILFHDPDDPQKQFQVHSDEHFIVAPERLVELILQRAGEVGIDIGKLIREKGDSGMQAQRDLSRICQGKDDRPESERLISQTPVETTFVQAQRRRDRVEFERDNWTISARQLQLVSVSRRGISSQFTYCTPPRPRIETVTEYFTPWRPTWLEIATVVAVYCGAWYAALKLSQTI